MQDEKPIEPVQKAPVTLETPESVSTAPDSPPVLPPTKKSHKKMITIILVSIVGLVVVATVAFLILQALMPKTNKSTDSTVTTNPSSSTSTATTTTTTTSQQLVTDLGSILKEKYKSIATTTVTVKTDETYSAAYSPDGAGYYVTAPKGASVSATDTAVIASNDWSAFQTDVSNAISDYLTNNSFTKLATPLGGDVESNTYYMSDSIICDTDNLSMPVVLICGDKADYASVVTAVKPFADAFAKSDGVTVDTAKYEVYRTPTVNNDTSAGYKTANVSMSSHLSPIGGFMGLFYMKEGGDWQYFTGTQSVMDCSDFNTTDLKAAYAGTECYDSVTGSQTTLQ